MKKFLQWLLLPHPVVLQQRADRQRRVEFNRRLRSAEFRDKIRKIIRERRKLDD